MKLILQPKILAIVQLPSSMEIPNWASKSSLYSITKTKDELSIVCEQSLVPEGTKMDQDWQAFKVDGVLDFSLTGILYQLAKPLAEAEISIFAISTYNTDYILVKKQSVETVKKLWIDCNHMVIEE